MRERAIRGSSSRLVTRASRCSSCCRLHDASFFSVCVVCAGHCKPCHAYLNSVKVLGMFLYCCARSLSLPSAVCRPHTPRML